MKAFLAILFLLILVANILLLVLGILDSLVFWVVLLVVAIFAFKVLPMIKK
jgi:hypothetical protein